MSDMLSTQQDDMLQYVYNAHHIQSRDVNYDQSSATYEIKLEYSNMPL